MPDYSLTRSKVTWKHPSHRWLLRSRSVLHQNGGKRPTGVIKGDLLVFPDDYSYCSFMWICTGKSVVVEFTRKLSWAALFVRHLPYSAAWYEKCLLQVLSVLKRTLFKKEMVIIIFYSNWQQFKARSSQPKAREIILISFQRRSSKAAAQISPVFQSLKCQVPSRISFSCQEGFKKTFLNEPGAGHNEM